VDDARAASKRRKDAASWRAAGRYDGYEEWLPGKDSNLD
jgi:hypothetical protein